jgi:hypothetical protein
MILATVKITVFKAVLEAMDQRVIASLPEGVVGRNRVLATG